jgi:glycosyltransferase involved in cell wall biosynthesis
MRSPNGALRLGMSAAYDLWRKLPVGVRRRAFDFCIDATFPTRRPPSSPPSTLVLCGLFRSGSSMGWTARYLAYLLQQNDIRFAGYDISHLFFADDVAAEVPPPPATSVPVTLLLALMPNRYRYALSSLPRRLVRNAYIIGYSVYELERLPDDYRRGLRDVDEVWTPSSFSAAGFSAAAPTKPVRVIPHIIRAPDLVSANREAFGLPPSAFLAMAFGNIKSGTTRKNLIGAVEAFQQAFPDRHDVRLVLKVSDQDWAPERTSELGALLAKDPRVILHSETLSDDEIWSFMACADAIVSLHRAEGFGLVLAQALMLGRPLVTTLWSGPCDFLSPETVFSVDFELVPVRDPEGIYVDPQARWVEPSIAHAAALLRQIEADPDAAREVAERGRRALERFMTPRAWAEPLNKALCRRPVEAPRAQMERQL